MFRNTFATVASIAMCTLVASYDTHGAMASTDRVLALSNTNIKSIVTLATFAKVPAEAASQRSPAADTEMVALPTTRPTRSDQGEREALAVVCVKT